MGIINNQFKNRAGALAALFLILATTGLSAQPGIRLFRSTTAVKAGTVLSASSANLSIDRQALASVLSTPHFILQHVPLPQVAGIPQSVDLDLTEFTVIGEHTKISYLSNGIEIPRALPSVRTYRGKVQGNPNTLAFIAAEPNGNVSGFIRFDGQENFSIGVASRTDSYTSVITPMSTLPSGMTQCNMDDAVKYSPNGIHPLEKSSVMKIQAQPTAAAKTCVVAIDEDFACYSEFGDYTDYITARLAAITTVYESEIGVAMSLGPMHVFTTPDPYSGSNSDALLRSFTNYWVANHQGDAGERTLAHLISRRLGGGGAQGIAWVEGMCRPADIGYALTNISGNSPGIDEAVMAHELGHNVGSQHTHDCAAYPPSGLDHCFPAEGGCSWATAQTIGCIMSYCNQKDFSFHTRQHDDRVVQTLQTAVDAATCLATLAKITVNDTAIHFPKTVFNTTKDTTVKAIITNNGTEADLKILSATIDGHDATEFKIKNPPKFPVILKTGESFNITITFKPTYGGDDIAQLVIGHNASGGASYIQLSGRSAVPAATFIHDAVNDPNYILDFGTVHDKNPIDSTLIYVRNDGDAPLKITKSWFTSDTNEFSIVSGAAPAFVAPGAEGSMVVRFKAKTNGFKSNVYLDFKSNDPANDTATFVSSLQVSADVSNLSVASSHANDVQVYVSPNPFKGKLRIELRAGSEYLGKPVSVNIFDNLGRKIVTIDGSKLNAPSEELSWQPDATLSEGTYTLVAKIGEQETVKQVVYIK